MKALILLLVAHLFSNAIVLAAESNKKQEQSTIASADTAGRKSYGAIKGVVLDKTTRKPLAGVNIIVAGTRRGTTTIQDGAFTITKMESGKYALTFMHIGYITKKYDNILVSPGEIVDIQIIEMEEQPILLKEMVVTPGSYSIMGSESTVRQTLTSEDIKIMGWAEDITRAVQRVPGISGNDFSAKFNVRGGDVDEVLVLLDGLQIYKPFHQKDFGGGFFSTVDIETIEGVDLLTGGFTAEYGERMSGVLDLKTKRAKEGKPQTSIGLSLMNARAFSMGNLKRNTGSWLLSARRGYLDIINTLTGNQFKLRPKYYDVLGKVEYQLHRHHALSAHVFLANDAYKLDERVIEKGNVPNMDYVNTKYGNNYGWLTLDSFFRPQLRARTLLYGGSVTQKRLRNLFDDDPQKHLNSHTVDDDRDFSLFGLKTDWAYEVSKNIFLKSGVDVKQLNATFSYSRNIRNEFVTADHVLTDQVDTLDVRRTQDGHQLGSYLSGRFRIFNPLALEAGLRYDYYSYTGDKLWSPRAGMVLSLSSATSLRAGWGYYYQSQGIDDLRIEFGESSYYPAQLSKHYGLGFEHRFTNGLQFRAEGYLKKISDLQDYYVTFANIDEFFPETRDDLIKLTRDKATTKGIELYVKHDTGNKFSWWLSYGLSEATDHVTDLQYEGPLLQRTGTLPRFWDQRHTANLDVNFRPNRKWHFNFAWQYRNGWPYTPFTVARIARGDGTFAYYHDYGLFNSRRYPAFHRLDVRINRQFYSSSRRVTVFLHIINAYNHENINNYDSSILEESADGFRHEIDTETWFPILPFVGVSWEF